MKKNETKKTGNKRKTKKNNNILFGIACTVVGLLVILVFFLVKKDQIFTNLKETDFFENVFGATPQVIENHQSTTDKTTEIIPLKNEVTITIETQEEQNLTEQNSSQNATQNQKDETPSSKITEDNLSQKEITQGESTSETQKKENQKSENAVKTESAVNKTETGTNAAKIPAQNYDLQLCFVEIDGDGLINRKIIKRTVPKSDSPLTNAINLLIKGPDTTKSAEKNCMSVIPKDTKLLSAKVQDGIAYLNFNDALEFNQDGVVGKNLSLEQIVFTATAFSTVKSVQILIEGKKQDYLGSEGTWIGSPLSRANY